MWDESLIESKRGRTDTRKLIFWPFALLVHASVIAALVTFSYWHVEAVEGPQSVTVFMMPKGLPPAALGDGGPPMKQGPRQEVVRKVVATEIVPETNATVEQSSVEENLIPSNGEPGEGDREGVIGGFGEHTGSQIGIGETPVEKGPVILTAEMQKPLLIHKVEPEYPPLAIRAGIEGLVHLQAVISKTGAVEDLKVLSSSHPLLTQAATNAVRQWKYSPATINGKPLTVYFTVTVKFSLR